MLCNELQCRRYAALVLANDIFRGLTPTAKLFRRFAAMEYAGSTEGGSTESLALLPRA